MSQRNTPMHILKLGCIMAVVHLFFCCSTKHVGVSRFTVDTLQDRTRALLHPSEMHFHCKAYSADVWDQFCNMKLSIEMLP